MKIISFALFGADAKYRRGMMDNIRAAPKAYPGWQLFIYCDRVNHEALMQEELGAHAKCILQQETSQGVEGMSWRFLAVLHPGAEAVLFRDADSIFTQREVSAVNEWIASDCTTHIIRDHPYHASPIMGGLLGVRGSSLALLANLLTQQLHDHRLTEYGDDQVFLSKDLYPRVLKTAMVHTNSVRYFPELTRPLPPDVPDEHFIGAYAYLTDAEHLEFESIRAQRPPVTFLPKSWEHHRLLKKVYQKLNGVQRIKYNCRWCL